MKTPVSFECLSKVGGGYIDTQVAAGRCHETHKSWVLKFSIKGQGGWAKYAKN